MYYPSDANEQAGTLEKRPSYYALRKALALFPYDFRVLEGKGKTGITKITTAGWVKITGNLTRITFMVYCPVFPFPLVTLKSMERRARALRNA